MNTRVSLSSSSSEVLCLLFWVFKLGSVFMSDLYPSWRINDSNAIIRISTIEVKANTQQVLSVSALTGKLLRLHIPNRVTSCLPDWLPDSMVDPWIKVIRLSGLPPPKQQTVLLDEHKGFFVFLVFRCSSSPLLCVFNLIMILWGICKVKQRF